MSFSEVDLVRWLKERSGSDASVLVGIGDDGAVLDPAGRGPLVFACDQTVEGVHFERGEASWKEVGHKALARNLSDLAAMAARPWVALCSLSLPGDVTIENCRQLFAGILETAARESTLLVGGDLCRVPSRVAIDIAVIGALEGRRPLLRSAARAGDEILVTGELGASRQHHHLRFTPRWREAIALAATDRVHACIDLSDGLSIDLQRMAESSGVDACVQASSLPLRGTRAGVPCSITQALHDGEDFELLLAAAPGSGDVLASAIGAQTKLTRIGRVETRSGTHARLWLEQDGRRSPLPAKGYEHRFDT